jgi:hypothetical protein
MEKSLYYWINGRQQRSFRELKKDNGRLPVERSKDGILGAVDIHRISIAKRLVCAVLIERAGIFQNRIFYSFLFFSTAAGPLESQKFSGGLFFRAAGESGRHKTI